MTIPKRRRRKASDKAPCLHASGRWVKKVFGTTVYFTHKRDDPDGVEAQAIWNTQSQTIRQNIREGRKPFGSIAPPKTDAVTLAELCNAFLEAKERFIAKGELTWGAWDNYRISASKILACLGRTRPVEDLTEADFENLRASLAEKLSLGTLKVQIVRIKTIFKWGAKKKLYPPIDFGDSFNIPAAAKLRLDRLERPKKLFEQPELLRIMEAADLQLRAMTLLAINCGLGPADCARMKFKHANLSTGWLDFPRPKTGEVRRAKLWPETIAALNAEVAPRLKPSADDVVFLHTEGDKWKPHDISAKFIRLLGKLEMAKPGVAFYAIRHTLQTVAEDVGDLAAIQRVMGHTPSQDDMSARYRERIAYAPGLRFADGWQRNHKRFIGNFDSPRHNYPLDDTCP